MELFCHDAKFKHRLHRLAFAAGAVLTALALLACEPRTARQAGLDGGATAAALRAADGAHRELRVLLPSATSGAWPTGLDPATSTTGTANATLMNAVFGGLFQLAPDGDGFRIEGVLAESYELHNEGRTLVIRLREALVFSDGTPLDAAALAWNIDRALASLCVCAPTAWPWQTPEPIAVIDERTVALHFSRPYPAALHALPTMNINWPVSPAAFAALGAERFKQAPVGAGPFRVVANDPGAELVLERNPLYWQPERPHLRRLTFRAIGSEQAAWLALAAGDADVYEGLTSPALMRRAKSHAQLTATVQPSTSALFVQLNTHAAPFDDLTAREAIYYATDAEAIGRALFHEHFTRSRTFTAPGGLFHRDAIPGYREHDLEAAHTRVAALGGLRVTLGTLRGSPIDRVATALATQWARAGIEVAIESYDLAALVDVYRSGQWQAVLQAAGSYDPESIGGVSSRFRSGRPFSGVADPVLDALINAAASTGDPAARDTLYLDAGQRISDRAYAPFLFTLPRAQLTIAGVQGPGLTTPIPPVLVDTAVWWQDVHFAD